MEWLYNIDVALFRLVHQTLRLPLLDQCMPWLAGNPLFIPALIFVAAGLCWKGGLRGRVFLLVLAVTLAVGEGMVINTLKEAVQRPRPFAVLEGVQPLVGKGRSESLPSAHTSIWFAATMVSFIYYRRSWRWMLPLATLIAYSRVYLGVHFPSDTLAGAVLGAGYAAALLWTAQRVWIWAGSRWFPSWFAQMPSLVNPEQPGQATRAAAGELGQAPWVRLGYLWIGIMLLTRLWFVGSGRMELSEDEAYQWVWSKHLAASYYSKPPMIAYAQFFGTSLWGDTEFGVRFLSPVLSAVVSLILLRFLAREVNAQAGFCVVVAATVTPLLAVGSTLMTIDPLLVSFWVGCMVAGWRAVQPDGKVRHWLWCGLWAGLAFLSKYSALFLVPCFLIFFWLWPPARVQLRKPGPYLALLLILISTLPVLAWNAQNGWITVHHVAGNAKLDRPWTPTLAYFMEFAGTEAALLNPIFAVATVWAMAALWFRRPRPQLELYLFALGGPVLLGYWAYTLHSRVLANWIAPAVLPLLVLMVVYWQSRCREAPGQTARTIRAWFLAAVVLGTVAIVVLHDTRLIKKVTGYSLPPKVDPLRRVNGWRTTALVVDAARRNLLAEGQDVFIIGSHYGLTGQLSFYLPGAKEGVTERPLVYFLSSDRPKNQFFFWPQYRYREHRPGENAIFVRDTDEDEPPPAALLEEFESVENLGLHPIRQKGRVLRQVQMFACRNLH